MRLKIQSFGIPRRNTVDALVIVFLGGRTVRLSKTRRNTEATAERIESWLRVLLVTRDIHVHLNRDATFAYAIGKEPRVWPEDER